MIWKWLFQNLARMNLKLYFIFLVITAFLWLMMKLSDNYSKQYSIKISYENLPQGKGVLSASDTAIRVYISAEGFKLLTIAGGLNQEIMVPANRFEWQPVRNGVMQATINSSLFKPLINKQLGVSVLERNIDPASITLLIDDIDTIEKPIILDAKMNTAVGFRLYGLTTISPASVRLIGPRSILDTLKYVHTQNVVFSNLKSTTEKTIKLRSPHPSVQLLSKEVKFKTDVVEFVEAEMMVPIEVICRIPNLKIKTFPAEIKIQYQIAMPDYEHVTDTMFKVAVEVDSLTALRRTSLIPRIVKVPLSVENARLNISKVDFVIVEQ